MAAVRKWEMLAARWKWAPGSEKIKQTWTQETKSLLSTNDKIDALAVQKGFVVVQNNGKEGQKSVLHVKNLFFC